MTTKHNSAAHNRTQENGATYVLVYCRVSSERQVRDGNGIESQEFRCRQYSKAKGYIVEKVFRDEGVSGGLLERPAMQALVQYIDDHIGRNYVVLFDDLSRLARDVEAHWELKRRFGARNVPIECLNFNFEESPEGRFLETIMAGKNQMDREANRRGVIQKQRARLEGGYAVFCQPTGMFYAKDPVHKKLLHYDEKICAVLKEAIEGYAEQRFLTQADVQEFLQDHADVFIKKPRIFPEFTKRILTEILYAGYVAYEPWGIAPRKGHHKGFITIETYEKVQDRLQENRRVFARASDRPELPLRRLVFCAACEKVMTGSNVGGKLKHYAMYTCGNTACPAKPKNIRRELLEAPYVKLLEDISPREEVVQLFNKIALDKWQELTRGVSDEEKARNRQLQEKASAAKEYLELARKAKSQFLREGYEAQAEELGKELEEIKGGRQPSKNLDIEEALAEAKEFIRTPAAFWLNTDLQGKYIVHQLIFTENLHFDLQNGFRTPKLSLPFAVNRHFDSSKNALVEMAGIEPASKKEVRNRLLS